MRRYFFFFSLLLFISCGTGKKIKTEKNHWQQVKMEKRDSLFSGKWTDLTGKRELSFIHYHYSIPDSLERQFIESMVVGEIREEEVLNQKMQTFSFHTEEQRIEEHLQEYKVIRKTNPRFWVWLVFITIVLVISVYRMYEW